MRSVLPKSLQLTERKALLLVGDFLLFSVSLAASLLLWARWDPIRFPSIPWASEPQWFLLPLLWAVVATLAGCYDLRVAAEVSKALRSVAVAGGLVTSLYALAYFIAPRQALPRAVVIVHVLLTLALLAGWRSAYAYFLRRPAFLRRVLIVGAGSAGKAMIELIKSEGRSLYSAVGTVDDDPTKHGTSVLGIPVLGPAVRLTDIAEEANIAEVVVAVKGRVNPDVLDALLDFQERGIQVTSMSVLYESLTGRVPVNHVGENWFETLSFQHPHSRFGFALFKRFFDVLIASGGLVLFAALLPILAIAIKLDSRGPIFYRQQRLGKNGHPYWLFKLRTMALDSEPGGKAVWASPGDKRITRVGRVLRASSLDEMPQLWNVVKGDMSMVGPRPERPEFVEQLEAQIPYYRLRHAVRPGLTGWAVLQIGYAGSISDALAKVEYDLYYIKHQSAWLDLQIILRSIAHGATLRRSETRPNHPRPATPD